MQGNYASDFFIFVFRGEITKMLVFFWGAFFCFYSGLFYCFD